VLPCKLEDAKKLSTDPRIQVLSFTGRYAFLELMGVMGWVDVGC
jgi:hypothetical protein